METQFNHQSPMQAIADAWATTGAAIARASGIVRDDGTRGHLTFTGKPLAPSIVDSQDGEIITHGVTSRGKRWRMSEDITFGSDVGNSLAALRRGDLERSRSAIDTGIDLTRYKTTGELRKALDGPDGEKVALALCPAVTDDAPGLFLVSELLVHLPEIVRVERQMPLARQLLPMKFLNAPGADGYDFNVIDAYGDAQWTSNFNGTPPMVGTDRKIIRRPLEYLWMGAQWGLRELWNWQQARSNGLRLPDFATERPRAAREAILRQENLWLMFGGPTGSKIYGVLSPENAIPKSNSAHWSTLSETANLKLIADKVALISATGVEVPTHLYMGVAQYIYYATTMFPDTQKSLLTILLENLRPLGIQEIVQVPELSYNAALKTALLAKKYDNETATRYAGGVDGKDAMLILSRNPAKIAGIVGQDVKSLAPEVRSAVTTVTLVMSSGGVEARYPNAHHILTFNAAP